MEGPPETLHTRISITRHPLMMPDDALPSAGAAIRYHPRPAIRATPVGPQRSFLWGISRPGSVTRMPIVVKPVSRWRDAREGLAHSQRCPLYRRPGARTTASTE
jgi:hypothetical protein